MSKNVANKMTLKKKLNLIVFHTVTKSGKWFDIFILLIIFLSVTVMMLESISSLHEVYDDVFSILEWTFTILFTIEYIIRISVSYQPKKYIFSFLGIVDLLALLPTYLMSLISGGSYLIVLRMIRLLRIFRILRLSKYLKEATILSNALSESRHKILVFLGAVTIFVIIMGTLMYIIESEESGFDSIPQSIYWAIVTITTVGYGDIVPVTILGKTVAAMLMLTGYAIIAVPTGIVSSEMTRTENKIDSFLKRTCSNCGHFSHEEDAKFCKICGQDL